jgi:tRNA G46 methylase TrmB
MQEARSNNTQTNNVNSITDAQEGIHKNLERVVKKHFNNPHKKPIAQHTQKAFDDVKARVEAHLKLGCPLIFDSCCGTAMSTQIIALENPDALVLGIDRSAVRLSKEANLKLPNNVILIQAECADFWSLAVEAGWKLQKHTILYPNPYPKSKHLKRRWHGHPSFPNLLALGGELELRSNWQVYIDEFCEAVKFSEDKNYRCDGVERLKVINPLTLFEKKYQESGQELYSCKISL